MKLQTKKVFFVGIAFLIISLFWQVYDNVIAKMLINTFGLNQTWSGVVMALDNIFALVLLPVFGALSDKTKTKYGKRTPYIFFGTIVAAVFLVGVSVFDNKQMKKLEDIEVGYVTEVGKEFDDEKNAYHYVVAEMSEDEKKDFFEKHTGDYLFESDLDQEQINSLMNFSDPKKRLKNMKKYYDFLDDETHWDQYKVLLTDKDKEKYEKEFKESFDDIDYSELMRIDTEKKSRPGQKKIKFLNDLICERTNEKYKGDIEGLKEELNKIGIRRFFAVKENATQVRAVLAWDYSESNIGYLIGFLTFLLIVLLAMSTFRTPAVSLMPDVVIKPLRSKANAIINLMGTVGGIIALGLMTFLAKDYQSYIPLFAVVGLLMIGLLVFFLATVNENKLVKEREETEKLFNIEETEEVSTEDVEDMPKDVRKSFCLIILSIIFWFMAYNAATTKFSVYAGDVLNMGYQIPLIVAQATALICFIPIGIIAGKIGRKKTILAGIIILFIAFVMATFATESSKVLIYITMGMAGIGWATINVNSYPMVVEMSKNTNIGKYTGYYYTASMFAQIITPILSGALMDASGTMRVLFPYSFIFCIFAFITMMFVKHGDSKPIVKKEEEKVSE